MPGSSWTVVKFIDEDSVEAVPTSWIFNKLCYWPPFQREKVMTAIRKNEEPNTHWSSYEISTFRNSTFDNYQKAREKCKKAECTSDLNSDTAEGKKKRIIRKKKIYSTSEEEYSEPDDDRSLPTPPPLKDVESNYEATRGIDKEIVQTYTAGSNKTISKQVSFSEETSECNLSLRTSRYGQENLKTSCKPQVDAQQNNLNNNIVRRNKENIDPSTNFAECACYLCPAHAQMQNNNEMYFKEIVRQLNYFKAQLWQTCEDIKDIKNNGRSEQTTTGISIRHESVFCCFTLPLKTEQELQEVEQFLKNTANMTTSITQASRVGGKHCYDFIKRNMSQLLSNSLAEKFSFFGKKQKIKFRDLKLAELLIAAGEACNETFGKKDLEEAIQKWLRRAKERANAEEKKLLTNKER